MASGGPSPSRPCASFRYCAPTGLLACHLGSDSKAQCLAGCRTVLPRVTEWWAAVWTSPMASEYIESDRAGLHLLAELHQRFWTAEGARTKASLSAEIRQQEARFGLSPVARRTLQWSIEKGETAEEKTTARRRARALQAAARKDPRDVLKVVRDSGLSET